MGSWIVQLIKTREILIGAPRGLFWGFGGGVFKFLGGGSGVGAGSGVPKTPSLDGLGPSRARVFEKTLDLEEVFRGFSEIDRGSVFLGFSGQNPGPRSILRIFSNFEKFS